MTTKHPMECVGKALSGAGSCPLQRAKVLHSEWEAEIDSRMAALQAMQRCEGRDLTRREAQALGGEWYRWYVQPREENPGQPGHSAKLREILIDLIVGVTRWWDYDDPEFQHHDRTRRPLPGGPAPLNATTFDPAKSNDGRRQVHGELQTGLRMPLWAQWSLRAYVETSEFVFKPSIDLVWLEMA